MKVVDTYYANIYMGLRSGYTDFVFDDQTAYDIGKAYCDEVKLGLTYTETDFVYVDGDEPGFVIGLINYPRFPSTPQDILDHAKNLGGILMKELEQERFSVVCPDITIMYEKGDFK